MVFGSIRVETVRVAARRFVIGSRVLMELIFSSCFGLNIIELDRFLDFSSRIFNDSDF